MSANITMYQNLPYSSETDSVHKDKQIKDTQQNSS